MSAVGAEALLAAGYSVFLLLIAAALDALARHSHRRSERFRTAGFAYHRHLDAWECPEGQHLHRVALDHERRLARYRGKAHVCNACPAKHGCTDSDDGREIAHALDPWPHSEAGRFHRAICVAMVALAALIAAIALVRNTDAAEVLLLGSVLAVTLAALVRMGEALRATPAGFPGTAEPRG
jgi:hypothetical protein